MEKKSVLIGVVLLFIGVAMLSQLGGPTGFTISNVYRQSGGDTFALNVGESVEFDGQVITLTSVHKGRNSFVENTIYDKNKARLVVDGRPAIVYEDDVNVVNGLVIAVSEVNTKDGFVRFTAKKVRNYQGEDRFSSAEYSLATFPEPFIKNSRADRLLLIGGDKHSEVEKKALAFVKDFIDDNSGRDIPVTYSELHVSRSTPMRREFENNVILVGQACTHPLIAEVLGTDVCDAGLEEGDGFVEVIQNGDRAIMVVTGHSPDDVVRAARFVKYFDEFAPLEGTHLFVKEGENPDMITVSNY